MIIPTEKPLQVGFGEVDSPPEYEEVAGRSPSSESTSTTIPLPSAATTSYTPTSLTLASQNTPRLTSSTSIQPVNNIFISHPFGAINCVYTIDPTLKLFPSSSKGTRIQSNIKLRTNIGSINADLTLVSGVEENIRTLPTATMDISSKMGSVDVKLRRSSTNVPTIRLHASSRTGSLSILIPTSFHGFIVAYMKIGRLMLTPSVQSCAVVLREEMKVKRIFIGDPGVLRGRNDLSQAGIAMSSSMYGGREAFVRRKEDGSDSESESDSESDETGSRSQNGRWKGDEIVLRTPMGSIEVGYVEDGNILLNHVAVEESGVSRGLEQGFEGRGRRDRDNKGRRGHGQGPGRGSRGGRGGRGHGATPGPHHSAGLT
ncbi:hypothetical protein F5050DRAFT_1807544 [Lentinula boryana]|uniref:DUF7330 domain-containing protein n=1 Tax=Lentinula boryana TaxID=40481 RepID=A0ABQ8QDR3_9AGAR|nr:hypothetical protein F5050DRAFT_1807544 [Lentinula boryana]